MNQELIQLSFDKIMQTRAYTVIVLGAFDKRFAIYTEAQTGKTLQLYLTGTEKVRPLTHDLISNIFKGFDIRIKQVVINDLKDTVYYARIFLELSQGAIKQVLEIDCRPSDAITLALMNNVPVFCTREVFDVTIPMEE